MSAGEVLGAVVGFGVIAFMLFGLVMLVIGVFGVLSDARDSLKDRADDIRGQRAEKRRRAEWKAERVAVEARYLVATFEGPSPLSAGADGDLLVTGHADGTVRLRNIRRDGEDLGGFSTGYGAGVGRVGISPDGRFVAMSERYGGGIEARLAGGELLGCVVPDSGIVASWREDADDMDGYLFLNEWISGFVFAHDAGGMTLTVAWDLQYGPDGGPGPNYGSGAVLVRSFRLREDGPPTPDGEILHDVSHRHPFYRRTIVSPDGSVIVGRAGSADVISVASENVSALREDVGWPLTATLDGRLVVSLLSTDEISEPYRESRRWTFSLWDTHAGERRRTWADAATSFGPAASVSPDGRHFAVEVREFRPAQDHPNVVGHERTVVRLYETATGALIGTLPIVPRFLVFTPDGEKLFTVESEGVKLWRV